MFVLSLGVWRILSLLLLLINIVHINTIGDLGLKLKHYVNIVL